MGGVEDGSAFTSLHDLLQPDRGPFSILRLIPSAIFVMSFVIQWLFSQWIWLSSQYRMEERGWLKAVS